MPGPSIGIFKLNAFFSPKETEGSGVFLKLALTPAPINRCHPPFAFSNLAKIFYALLT